MKYTKTWNQDRARLEADLFTGLVLAGGLYISRQEIFPFSDSNNGYRIEVYLIIPLIGQLGLELSFRYSPEKRRKQVAKNTRKQLDKNT